MNACLEVVLPSLLVEQQASVGTLCLAPEVINTFACELSMTLWCQDGFDSETICDMLQHPLLIEKVMTHSHDVSQAGTNVKHS